MPSGAVHPNRKPGLKPSLWDGIIPLGESRGGTPEGERALQGARRVARCGGCDPRLSAFRFPFILFLSFFLGLQSLIVMAAGPTAGVF
jgi:hypothetical protein